MMRMRGFLPFAVVLGLLAGMGGSAYGEGAMPPNGAFEDGQGSPDGWTLSGGKGEWVEGAVRVTGNGALGDTNYWLTEPLAFEPLGLYRMTFKARQIDGGTAGLVIAGPGFCNRDLGGVPKEWTPYTSIFVAPKTVGGDMARLRMGQWELNGTVAYDDVVITRAQAVYGEQDGLVLGEGESVTGNAYTFVAPLALASANFSRPLVSFTGQFNSNRWVMGEGSEVIYRHCLGKYFQQSGKLALRIGYYTAGRVVVEASGDGSSWGEVGSIGQLGDATFDLPAALYPSQEVWVRLRGGEKDGQPASLQVYGYEYRTVVKEDLGVWQGRTHYVSTPAVDERLKVTVEGFGEGIPGGQNWLVADIENVNEEVVELSPRLAITSNYGEAVNFSGCALLETGVNVADADRSKLGKVEKVSAGKGVTRIGVPYELGETGQVSLAFSLGEGVSYRAETTLNVARLFDASYGERLPGTTGDVALWWASSGWKISQKRPAPKASGNAVRIQMARNEVEAAQAVVRPEKGLKGFLASSQDLTGPNGAVIPAANVEVLRVRYVNVVQPTDETGVAAPWPDPLPPFAGPIDVAAGTNQPLWVRVKAPRDAAAGVYSGVIRLTADGYSSEVPIEVTVFDFMLPDKMTCTTAFGSSLGNVFRYHGVTDPADQRKVMELYYADFSAHHIFPYDPAPLDPFGVTWPNTDHWEGGMRDRVVKHDGESALCLRDEDTHGGSSATYDVLQDIPEHGLNVHFWYKTETLGQKVLLTLAHMDADGNWMPYRNTDIQIEGTGEWTLFERKITEFPKGAAKVRVNLWPCLYADDGSTTGVAWFDSFMLEDGGNGHDMIISGFEPLDAASLTPQFDWTAWDAAMTRAMEEWHYNAFVVPIPGMGGGTFHSRTEPSLLGYPEGSPEYKAAFTNYCQGLESHLREKGWLDMTYVYWFDEPEPKDYEFVMNGFRKIREAAPGIGRMLTEQVEPALVGGPNIWCPLTPSFDMKAADARRAAGDKFWWYICCGPHAPYVTLFIDHPGSELRVWGWQTWERRIDGLLIWETTYWTSECGYPDPEHPQNPYEDSMSWVSGYSTPAGAKIPWGNGDGRFMYPPEAGADGHPAGPIISGPVDSIRFEMLRDGIEDYEYMAQLDRLLRERGGLLSEADCAKYAALLEVPDVITEDVTHFTVDPAPMEARRLEVAAALAVLSK